MLYIFLNTDNLSVETEGRFLLRGKGAEWERESVCEHTFIMSKTGCVGYQTHKFANT